jgi:hypothetical protein
MLDDGAMGDALRASYNYSEFDIATEGYVARTNGGKTLFFEQVRLDRILWRLYVIIFRTLHSVLRAGETRLYRSVRKIGSYL